MTWAKKSFSIASSARRIGTLAAMATAVLAVTIPVLAHMEPANINGQAVQEFAGIPIGEWDYVSDWSPFRVTLQCGSEFDGSERAGASTERTETASAACKARNIADARPIERAFEDAMRFLAGEGLPSPGRLAPVVSPVGGLPELLVFSREMEEEAYEGYCTQELGEKRALALFWRLETETYLNAIGATRDAGDAVFAGPLQLPQWQRAAIATHELTHAIQDSSVAAATGRALTCEPEKVYQRLPLLYEGLAEFVQATYVRWNLLGDRPLAAQFRDFDDLDESLDTGLTISDYGGMHGAMRYYRGFFAKQNGYGTLSFFRHLAERYSDGSVRLHNIFFRPDDANYPGSEPDMVAWFAKKLEFELTTPSFGPTLALAAADIASWPDTRYDGRPRLENPQPPAAKWRKGLFSCYPATLSADDPVAVLAVRATNYASGCFDFTLREDRAGESLAHAQLQIEVKAETLRAADGLHLSIAQIMKGAPDASDNVQWFGTIDDQTGDINLLDIEQPKQSEERFFSCAKALDELGLAQGSKSCMPIRDGPIRQADGSFVVRWTVPMSLIADRATASVILTSAPTVDHPTLGPLPAERFVNEERQPFEVTAALRLVRDEAEPAPRDARLLAGDEPLVTACDAEAPIVEVPKITALNRSFGNADWAPFDFPDDIRSDLNSDFNRMRVGSLWHTATMAMQDDLVMIKAISAVTPMPGENRAAFSPEEDEAASDPSIAIQNAINRTRDGDDTLFGFAINVANHLHCNGQTDDDIVENRDNELVYGMEFSTYGADDEWRGYEYHSWDDLTPGRQFDVLVERFAATTSPDIPITTFPDRGTVNVLGRGEDWVRLRFELFNDAGPVRSFEAVLPFVSNFTWSSERQVVHTNTQAYYFKRWQTEQQFERFNRQADSFGRFSTDVTRPDSPLGAAIAACKCSCEEFSGFLSEFEVQKRAPASFLTCADKCCSSYQWCPLTTKLGDDTLRNMCTW